MGKKTRGQSSVRRKTCTNIPIWYRGLIADRFWSKVRRGSPTDCWLWLGRPDKDGYGRYYLGGIAVRAHRAAYYLANGNFDQTLSICHSCDNPGCVNPAHLWAGTSAENLHDMDIKGRRVRGSRHKNAKLTEYKVAIIRNSPLRGCVLARKYHVSESTISRIRSGRWWRHTMCD